MTQHFIRHRIVASLALATGIAAAAALSGCAAAGDSAASADCETTYTIGFSNPASEAASVKSLTERLKTVADERGCIKLLLGNTTGGDLEHQRAQLESWVTQGIDAIVVTPVDVTALSNLREQAQDKGIKWLSYGVLEEGADGLAGFDNVESGRIAGQAAADWVAEHHPDGDVTAAITTLTPLAQVSGRWDQPTEILTEAGVDIVSSQDCADQVCGQEIAEALIQSDPLFRVFIGFNDDAALGAAKAFRDAGIAPADRFIAGQDGSLPALDAIESGELNSTSAIVQEDLANSILDVSINAITGTGETSIESVMIAGTLASPDDLAMLLAQYK